ncbi:MAG: nucleoside hydrolase [Clostridiales bacterium]|jgi:inosine-uridine nucleoside N-ribohydrolase|nr:nucleoside hydrolase [Clostridiales bacterium]MDR2749431.1 nucleoside hydrolase [Clostridiales bacterium]
MDRAIERKKIIIDTDIGDDIDDHMAIALAAKSPELQIVGVTTVHGDVAARAAMARKELDAFSLKDVPVCEGCEHPLTGKRYSYYKPEIWEGSDLGTYSSNLKEAADFIVQTIAKDPDTVIVCMGPLTNIACAVELKPEVMEKATVYAMGGAFDSAFPEYNISKDPEAAEIVINGVSDIRFFGLELTTKCFFDTEDLYITIKNFPDPIATVAQKVDLWLCEIGYSNLYLHDAFPICALISPNRFTYKKVLAKVERKGKHTRGTMVYDPGYFHQENSEFNIQIAQMKTPSIVTSLFEKRVFGVKIPRE